jgi:Uma2 family endonuclease
MVAIATPTLEEFLQLPETKPATEYFLSTIEKKPIPEGEHSTLQGGIATLINQKGELQKLIYAFPELRCTFAGISIVPDIVVFEWANIPLKPHGRIENKITIAPDWIIEILSPEQSQNKVIQKILFCLQQGTKLGWLIDRQDESVMILYGDRPPEIQRENDNLPPLSPLENWQITAQELFNLLNFV